MAQRGNHIFGVIPGNSDAKHKKAGWEKLDGSAQHQRPTHPSQNVPGRADHMTAEIGLNLANFILKNVNENHSIINECSLFDMKDGF